MHQKELLKGSTEPLLLSLLATEPMYGYQLVKEMAKRSSGYFQFSEGTLYPALHRLERDGLASGRWFPVPGGHQRRYYQITDLGQQRLVQMQSEWRQFTQAVSRVLKTELT